MGRRRTDLGRIVADIMIAGQIAAGDGEGCVQCFGEFEIVAIARAIEGEVAAVDHEIGAVGVDIFADPVKIFGQRGQAAGKMGIGNLGQAKFGHLIVLTGQLYIL
jgi:hypothetical protein